MAILLENDTKGYIKFFTTALPVKESTLLHMWFILRY